MSLLRSFVALAGTLASALAAAQGPATAPPAATVPAPARAETAPPPAIAARDGAISLAEFQRDLVASFRALDLDGDGYITEAEIRALPDAQGARRMLRMLRSADLDKDGRLSFAEVVKARMRFFDEADTDGDDRLSRAEIEAWQRTRAAERARRLAAAETAAAAPGKDAGK